MSDRNQPGHRKASPATAAPENIQPEADRNEDPESSQSMDPFVMQTQKGQGKEDGDPSEESDQPVEQQNI